MNATERARRSDALYKDDAKMHRRDLCDMVAQREAEIEKLRELVRDMLKTIHVMDEEWHSLTDFTTMAEAAETYDFKAENAPEYEEKLHELGIEV